MNPTALAVSIGAVAVLLMVVMGLLVWLISDFYKASTRPKPIFLNPQPIHLPPPQQPMVSWLDQQMATNLQRVADNLQTLAWQNDPSNPANQKGVTR